MEFKKILFTLFKYVGHQCFGDIRPTSASQGDWKVKENNNTCARYKMKVGSYITYPTMKNEVIYLKYII